MNGRDDYESRCEGAHEMRMIKMVWYEKCDCFTKRKTFTYAIDGMVWKVVFFTSPPSWHQHVDHITTNTTATVYTQHGLIFFCVAKQGKIGSCVAGQISSRRISCILLRLRSISRREVNRMSNHKISFGSHTIRTSTRGKQDLHHPSSKVSNIVLCR